MKASLTLANGTKVEIDGAPDEVQRLLATFSGSGSHEGGKTESPSLAYRPCEKRRALTRTPPDGVSYRDGNR